MADNNPYRTNGSSDTLDPDRGGIGDAEGKKLAEQLGLSDDEPIMDDNAIAEPGQIYTPADNLVNRVYDDDADNGIPSSHLENDNPEDDTDNSSPSVPGHKKAKKSANDQELSDAENGGLPKVGSAEKKEGNNLGSALGGAEGKDDVSNFVKNKLGGKGASAAKTKVYGWVGAALGSVVIVLVALILILTIIGPLKTLHFANVLQSVGFATFQRTMGKAYGQVVFDRAVISDGSKGTLGSLKGTGYNEARLTELGRKGLKWTTSARGVVSGMAIPNNDGTITSYSLDDTAKRLGLGESYESLRGQSRLRAQSAFIDEIKRPLTEALGDRSLAYRSEAFNRIRSIAKISMFRWPRKALDYIGKDPRTARGMNMQDVLQRVNKGPLKPPSASNFQEEARTSQESAITAREQGTPTPTITNGKLAPDWVSKLSSGAKSISTILAIGTIYCILIEVDNAYEEALQANETNALSLAHDHLTVADQITAGDATTEAINANNESLVGAESSVAYRQQTGKTLTEADVEEIGSIAPIFPSSIALNILHNFLGGIDETQKALNPLMRIPIMGQVQDATTKAGCTALLNQAVQWIIAGAEMVIGVVSVGLTEGVAMAFWTGFKQALSLGASVGVGAYVGGYIQSMIDQVGGINYTGVATGPKDWNETYQATSYFNASSNRTFNYGRPIPASESINNSIQATNDLRNDFNRQGFTERYFAIDNPFSLVGQTVAQIPTTTTGFLVSLNKLPRFAASLLAAPLKFASAASGAFMSSPVAAAGETAASQAVRITPQQAGIVDFGYTRAEEETIATNPDFQYDALKTYMDAHGAELTQKYSPCYTPTLQSQILDNRCLDTSDTGFLATPEALKYRWWNAMQSAGTLIDTALSTYSSLSIGSDTGGASVPGNGKWAHPTGGNTSHGWTFYSKSPYGFPPDYIHGGVDFSIGRAKVFAACSGTIKVLSKGAKDGALGPFIKSEWTYSNVVVIDCDDSYGPYEVGYHHTSALDGLSVGSVVTLGQPIGISDDSGNSSGAHLHFTVKDTRQLNNGYRGFVDPTSVIKDPALY